ncbi:hypothetical protein V6N13_108527 [Hibiscus sabdariffa]|uniref:Uncharacterized protein n=1 Tax=Hibiscus sabdariffa TaxID=183260 RepID=A0ABR2SSE4_9ROSI
MSKGKSSTSMKQIATFHVRKPLQLNLADFPMLSRNGHKASSSKQSSSPKNDSRLDRSRHSSIIFPENSDPNIQNSVSSLAVNNLVGEHLKKPLDPIIPVPPKPGHTQENVSVDMQHDAHSVDVLVIVGDAHGSAMLE